MSWTDERVETLKTMWGEGKSASQIAKELGGVTRNAVIGKVHRLGLSNRNGGGGSGAAAKAEPKEKAAAPAPKPAAPKPAPEPTPQPAAAAPIPWDMPVMTTRSGSAACESAACTRGSGTRSPGAHRFLTTG